MEFSNAIVLVTGSSRGIGKAIALAFAKTGASVVLNSAHHQTQLLKTYQQFLSENLKVMYFFGDISDFSTATAMMEEVETTFGTSPTILINNAGISHSGLFTDTTPTLWTQVMHTNLTTAYNCSYLVVPKMIAQQKGIIINISSIWGQVGASCEVAYSTSKSALNGFTKALAKELGPSHIRVNAIACGWIDTAMNNSFTEEEKKAFIDEVPLCRTGTPSEVAAMCLFLASSNSSYMTGQVLTLDGGLL